MPNDNSSNRNYPLPHPDNSARADCQRIRDALNAIDVDIRDILLSLDNAATQADLDQRISDLVAAAPAALDTLNELAAALGDDPNFATTITNQLAQKADIGHTHTAADVGAAPASHTHTAADAGAPPTTRAINTSGLATGGGDLSADRTIDVPIATQAEAEAGTDNTKGMTPLRVKQAIDANSNGSIPDVIIEDQKTTGAAGGSATSGAWYTRDLNTIVRNNGSIASLSGNEFTLPPGDYYIEFECVFSYVRAVRTRLFNVSSSSSEFKSVSCHTDAYQDRPNFVVPCSGVVSVTSNSTFRIEYFVGSSRSGDGLGRATSIGSWETYARVLITQL